MNIKNCESILNKSILNTNTSNEANNENNVLKNLRLKSMNKVIIGHINISSLRNKFELLTEMIRDKVYLLMIFDRSESRSESDKKAYNKQRNKCVGLLRKTKRAY